MSVEFRQRTPGEYAQILWRRKWLIALPAVAIAFAVAIVVWKLPNVYESKTLLTVRPSSISSDVVPRLAEADLTIRINNIQQEVFSRSSLQPIIEKYGLYAVERRRGEPMDVLVERMRTRDINVRLSTSREVTNGFELLFRGPDPRVTMNVTAELASKYTKAQAKAATEDATQTKEFFESKLRQAKDELDAIDQQRLQFMMQNKEHLPSSANALIGQLAGLREEQKSINTSLDLLRQRRASLATQQADAVKQRAEQIDLAHYDLQDPKTTPAYASLVTRREQLKSDRQRLLTEYRDKHPDVLSKQAEIDNVQREINEMIADWKQRIEERRKKLEAMSDPRVSNYQQELRDTDAQIAALQKRNATTDAQITDINQRLGGVPTAEVGLEALNREYQSKKAVYDDLLAQNQKADIISSVQANAQGESIAVIDSANMPERPVAPNRPVWMLFGLFVGLGVGLTCAALFEVPRLLTIQTSEDAEHYTGLPVLVSLPNLLTPREQRRLRLRRAALAVAGVLVTVASIPALALLLRMTRLVEFLAMRG
jgi:polysaccharide chain length determinant protein (PEP-CTERM system associated)